MHRPLNSSTPQLSIQTYLNPFDPFSDSRKHGYQGTSRNVRLGRVIPPGGGAIAKSEDGIRCAVTGKECRVIQANFIVYPFFMNLEVVVLVYV